MWSLSPLLMIMILFTNLCIYIYIHITIYLYMHITIYIYAYNHIYILYNLAYICICIIEPYIYSHVYIFIVIYISLGCGRIHGSFSRSSMICRKKALDTATQTSNNFHCAKVNVFRQPNGRWATNQGEESLPGVRLVKQEGTSRRWAPSQSLSMELFHP